MLRLPAAGALAGFDKVVAGALLVSISRTLPQITGVSTTRLISSDGLGNGAGRGGGSGGAIREAGGAFGKREAAHEEQYFRKKQAEQLSQLHDHIQDEIRELWKQVRCHEEAVKRLQMKINSLRKTSTR